VKEVTMVTTALGRLNPGVLAQLLFACPLQPSELPSPAVIMAAVAAQFGVCREDLMSPLEVVAQEAGDRPDLYAARMRWALRCVALAYPDRADPGRPVVAAGDAGCGPARYSREVNLAA
jgi:hypothetical protein